MTVTGDLGLVLNPIGIVHSTMKDVEDIPLPDRAAEVEIHVQYQPALLRIEENSHLWLLLWFHKSNRQMLVGAPRRLNPDLPDYGVFSLRSPNRPNPIALYLVELVSRQGNILKVKGIDAIDQTPVLDIKPYYEQDIVFSPRTSYIRAADRTVRHNIMLKEALRHHQESCRDANLAVRMALAAEEYMGHLNRPELNITVYGSRCLGDTLQGLTRARLANPARFTFRENTHLSRSIWERPGRNLMITAREIGLVRDWYEPDDEDLFTIELSQT